MRTRSKMYHYLLSFADTTLVRWFNTCVVDAFGDYSEQTIRVHTDEAEDAIKKCYSLETLHKIMSNKKTKVTDDSAYIAVSGGDEPFICTFNEFEEYLNLNIELVDWVLENPELLTELEKMED